MWIADKDGDLVNLDLCGTVYLAEDEGTFQVVAVRDGGRTDGFSILAESSDRERCVDFLAKLLKQLNRILPPPGQA